MTNSKRRTRKPEDNKKTESQRVENKKVETAKTTDSVKMSTAKNVKITWERVKDRVGEAIIWARKNKKTSIPALVVILVVFVALIVTVSTAIRSSIAGGSASGQTEETEVNVVDATEVKLEENAVAGVNKLMESYYNAMADGDVATIESIKGTLTDTEQIEIEKKSAYIESYDNLKCYTKTGYKANSYLVFVYTDAKFKDVDTKAPSLNSFYVDQDENGQYRIYEGNLDENVMIYLQKLSSQDDVTNLCNDIQAKYNEAVEADENLKELMDKFPDMIKEEVAVEIASREVAKESEEAGTEESTESEENTETEVKEAGIEIKEVEATDTVNVRKSDSEEGEKIGKVSKGTRLTLIEKKENGWSKIKYEDQEAYIKSEFLADVVENPEKPEETKTQEDTAKEENASQETANKENTASEETAKDTSSQSANKTVGTNGKVMALETVNVRKTASETGDKLGVVFPGETLELVQQQADGWCKVKYNGETGYVKTEFVK